MSTSDQRKSHSTDDQETSVQGVPASDPGSANLAPGTLLNNRYLLVRQLGVGGFGSVHLAHDQQMHDRPVVVKIQIQQRIDDPWFERKFSEEVRALSLLDHPGVVVAFDSGRTPEGMPFLVMQYVDGVTMRNVMKPEGMPLPRVADIVKQLGSALGAAHEKGIWHRDLKPENVMLQNVTSGEDRVRLIDFGIATVADIKSKYQTNTRVAGSVLYMAPEQTMGQASAATDIYAMGLIAYEMLTGRRPFPAENAMQMVTMQQAPVRVRPSDLRPSVPPAAEALILQSLEFDPARRPPSARQFGDQLHDALLGSGAGAPQFITTYSPASFGRPATFQPSGAAPPPLPPPPGSFANPYGQGPTAAPPPPPPPTAVAPGKQNKRKIGLIIAAVAVAWSIYTSRHDRPPKVVVEKSGSAPAPAQTAEAPSEEAIELAFWNSVKDSTDPQLYREYLSKYPDGEFASLANAKISSLTKNPPPAAPPKAPPAAAGQAANAVMDQVAKVVTAGNNKLAEIEYWDSVKESESAKAYQDYLDKYPAGLFATIAKMKISSLDKKAEPASNANTDPALKKDPGTPNLDPNNPNYRRPLPEPRPALPLNSYTGPSEGEIVWTGRILINQGFTIQGGQVNTGTITGDFPRVPITIEIPPGSATPTSIPVKRNNWDHLAVRNFTNGPVKSVTIHWKLIRAPKP